MLEEIADGVWVRQSAFCLTNSTVVRGDGGVLLIDPAVDGDDLAELGEDLRRAGWRVLAGFATHPHWDHVLWHPSFGDAARFGTAACAARSAERIDKLREATRRDAPGASLDLVGGIAALPAGARRLPWPGPEVTILEHRAHASGHAALVIEEAGVLVAGDMLSDVEVPLFDPEGPRPCQDYLDALDVLEGAATGRVVIPGHGAVAGAGGAGARIEADRAYCTAAREGRDPADPRVGPGATYGADWLPAAHRRNLELARG